MVVVFLALPTVCCLHDLCWLAYSWLALGNVDFVLTWGEALKVYQTLCLGSICSVKAPNCHASLTSVFHQPVGFSICVRTLVRFVKYW